MCPDSVGFKINNGEHIDDANSFSGSMNVNAFSRGPTSRVSSLGVISGGECRGASANRFRGNTNEYMPTEDSHNISSLSRLQRKLMPKGNPQSR